MNRNGRALNSAVECHLHTVEVIGSNPIAPTINFLKCSAFRLRMSRNVPWTLLAFYMLGGTFARQWNGCPFLFEHRLPACRRSSWCKCSVYLLIPAASLTPSCRSVDEYPVARYATQVVTESCRLRKTIVMADDGRATKRGLARAGSIDGAALRRH